MKWTVVIEIEDEGNLASGRSMKQGEIEDLISVDCGTSVAVSYRVMEVIAAPYGAQHPGGVFISEVKKASKS